MLCHILNQQNLNLEKMTTKNYTVSASGANDIRNIQYFRQKFFLLFYFFVLFSQVKAQSEDITVNEITFKSEGVTLAGTIYTPLHSHASVVLVHGSGQATRMQELARLFAENGISTLTYDKRGVGESQGIYVGPEVGKNNVDPENLYLLAKDVNAALNVLREQNKNIPGGLVGISQAGWIIPIAANLNPYVDFVVLFSGPVVPTLEQLRFQFMTKGNSDFLNDHTEEEIRKRISIDAEDHIHFSEADRLNFVSTDPNEALNNLSIPGLWIFGAKDAQIPIGLSIEHLNTFKAQGKPYEYCLFAELDHNTAFSDSTQPVSIAIHWIKNRLH